jgi:hypothetical protein
MSIKVKVLSPDVDRQIELLKLYPEIAEKYYRPAFQAVTTALTNEIRPTIPVASGRAVSKFRGKVTGTGVKLAASIGWGVAKNAPWYINVVEYGARDHPLLKGSDIRGSRRKLFRYQRYKAAAQAIGRDPGEGLGVHVKIGKSGAWRTIAIHPGFAARGFMKAGAEKMAPLVDAIMGPANEAVAKELCVP